MPCWVFPLKQETLIEILPKKKKKDTKQTEQNKRMCNQQVLEFPSQKKKKQVLEFGCCRSRSVQGTTVQVTGPH